MHNGSDIFEMKCLNCPVRNSGHTDGKSHTRYRKHTHAVMNNNSNSNYSSHILNMGHAYGIIIDTTNIIRTQKNGKYLNTLKEYHTYKSVKITYT
jgi:hypothetical protein